MVPYLSSGLTPLSDVERAAAEQIVADCEALIAAPSSDDEDVEKLTLLTKMFMAKPSAGMSDLGAASRGESYMVALDDLPAWAIAEAIKLWYRGDVQGFTVDDFKWTPDSAVLRKIAKGLIEPYRENIKTVQRLLEAKPLEEVLG